MSGSHMIQQHNIIYLIQYLIHYISIKLPYVSPSVMDICECVRCLASRPPRISPRLRATRGSLRGMAQPAPGEGGAAERRSLAEDGAEIFTTKPLENHRKTIGKPQDTGGLMGFYGMYPLAMTNIAIEHGCLQSICPLKAVIFHSFVSLPEGTLHFELK